jgi:hypothetical protein
VQPGPTTGGSLCAALLIAGAACDGGASFDGAWEIGFESGALRSEVSGIEVFVLRGDCESGRPVYERVLMIGGEMQDVDAPPPLPPVPHAFGARGYRDDCGMVGVDCDVHELGQEDPHVVSMLRSQAGPPSCASGVCTGGLCADFDAGIDAGRDAGTDAAPPDAGIDATEEPDAEPPEDTGPTGGGCSDRYVPPSADAARDCG